MEAKQQYETLKNYHNRNKWPGWWRMLMGI
jgi:hypothetical protein